MKTKHDLYLEWETDMMTAGSMGLIPKEEVDPVYVIHEDNGWGKAKVFVPKGTKVKEDEYDNLVVLTVDDEEHGVRECDVSR